MSMATIELIESTEFNRELESIIRNGDPEVLTFNLIKSALEKHFKLAENELKQKKWKKLLEVIINKAYATVSAAPKETKKRSREETADKQHKKIKKEVEEKKKEEVKKIEKKVGKFEEKKVEKKVVKNEEKKVVKDDGKKKQVKRKARIVESEDEEDMEEDTEEDAKRARNEVKVEEEEDTTVVKAEEEEVVKMPIEQEKEDSDQSEDSNNYEEEKVVNKCPQSKKTSSPTISSPHDETIKRLKKFINKCGVRKVWSKELADCKSPTSQIRKLKAMLEELGVKGRPTIEKCEAIKAERELKAELDSLDTTLILNEEKTEGRPRTRAKKNKPSYVIPADTESEEEEGEESEDESEEDSEEDSEDEFEEMSEDD